MTAAAHRLARQSPLRRRIVERMDGRIAVTSQEGVGSTFSVEVPLPPSLDVQDANFVPPDLNSAAVMIIAAAAFRLAPK